MDSDPHTGEELSRERGWPWIAEGWERHKDDKGKPYYHNKTTHSTQWAHPLETYYRGLVFMRKEGDQLLEDKAVHNPPTPEETREMAKYFGIDPHVCVCRLVHLYPPLVSAALTEVEKPPFVTRAAVMRKVGGGIFMDEW